MNHPLPLAIQRTDLILAHALACARLERNQARAEAFPTKDLAHFNLLAIGGLLLALLFAGVALMLWSVNPGAAFGQGALLLWVPLAPLLLVGLSLWVVRVNRRQALAQPPGRLELDLAVLRDLEAT